MIVIVILGVFLAGLIAYWILHEVIQSAIDNSTMARNIQEIRDHLVGKSPEPPQTANDEDHENCPGCGYLVHLSDKVCANCGLALRDSD
ncbi:hypothetical protein PghCCS26_47120 [Paenibacillus glycanilyticus]|uniref:Zinc ribbon domain-containing protein n=1 Tax=Paenibacillus glycanilyticus TaxID=126569 RepID=A0ABQ6NTX2_9BACL|nr:zinc ribbon domain-containing protein [Paenibacillus glycanilyticus]GMK47582.1 hypothetical protein PghCCS26_47120 [Paenibacillus glycanilyticus]